MKCGRLNVLLISFSASEKYINTIKLAAMASVSATFKWHWLSNITNRLLSVIGLYQHHFLLAVIRSYASRMVIFYNMIVVVKLIGLVAKLPEAGHHLPTT